MKKDKDMLPVKFKPEMKSNLDQAKKSISVDYIAVNSIRDFDAHNVRCSAWPADDTYEDIVLFLSSWVPNDPSFVNKWH